MFHYRTYFKSVNSEKYIEFLKELKKKHGKGPLVLYMDNLMVHKSKNTMKVYEELGITPIWSPIYLSLIHISEPTRPY